jgi:hypothetical protein
MAGWREARLALGAWCSLTAGCTQVVRYTESLVDERSGRTLVTRLPATVGATVGFAVGVPVDIVAFVPAWLLYRTQPKETRDPVSWFLFPSFVLWKVGALVGTPFDGLEWLAWRSWRDKPAMSEQEREAIERTWDDRLHYDAWPVTPVYPLPADAGGRAADRAP